MKEEKDYIHDISEIRSMMERSSKFLSLSGWAGILAGIYALAGAYIAWKVFDFNPDGMMYNPAVSGSLPQVIGSVVLLAIVILVLALGTAIYFSRKKSEIRGEKLWNPTSRRLLIHMAIPLFTGGFLILILMFRGMIGFAVPLTLIFYGLALFNAGNFTFKVVKIMGIVQITLGLLGCLFIEYGLLFWTIGFGLVHIAYGVYMYFRYER